MFADFNSQKSIVEFSSGYLATLLLFAILIIGIFQFFLATVLATKNILKPNSILLSIVPTMTLVFAIAAYVYISSIFIPNYASSRGYDFCGSSGTHNSTTYIYQFEKCSIENKR